MNPNVEMQHRVMRQFRKPVIFKKLGGWHCSLLKIVLYPYAGAKTQKEAYERWARLTQQ